MEDIAENFDQIVDGEGGDVIDMFEGGSKDGIRNLMAHAERSKL
jgi:hypothetical protein